VDVPSADVECSDGAVVGSVSSVDVPSADVKSSNGAVVGSVSSVDVPSADVECSDGAVAGVTMFSSHFLLTTDDELAESRHALNDRIQARRRKKRLRKGVSVSGSLLT
jgi:hypothetical protein